MNGTDGQEARLTLAVAQQFTLEPMMPLTMSTKGLNIVEMAHAMRGLQAPQRTQPLLGKDGELRLDDGKRAGRGPGGFDPVIGAGLVQEGLHRSLASLGVQDLTAEVLGGVTGQKESITPEHVLELAAVMGRAKELREAGMDTRESVIHALGQSRQQADSGHLAQQAEASSDELPPAYRGLSVDTEAEPVDDPWPVLSPATGPAPTAPVRAPLAARIEGVQQAARAIQAVGNPSTAERASLWRTYFDRARDFSSEELLAAVDAKLHARFIWTAKEMCKPGAIAAQWRQMSPAAQADWLRGVALVHSRVYGMPPPDVVYEDAQNIPAWSLEGIGKGATKIILRSTSRDVYSAEQAVFHLVEALTARYQAAFAASDRGRRAQEGEPDTKAAERPTSSDESTLGEVFATLQALPLDRQALGMTAFQFQREMRGVATRAQQIAVGEEAARALFG